MAKTYNVDYFKDRKLKWEKNHGKFIHEFMFNEYRTRILGQCNTALNDLQRQLDLEIARAKAEELRIENKAHNELEKVYDATKFIDGISLNEVLNTTENLSKIFGFLYPDDHGHLALSDERGDLYNSYTQTLSALKDTNNDNVDKVEQSLEQQAQDNLDNLNKILKIANVTSTNNINDALNEKTVYPYASWKVDTNELETTTPDKPNKTLPNALSDSYNAIAQALNQLRFDHDSLVTRVSILENNHK